jgi:hypothetical protein
MNHPKIFDVMDDYPMYIWIENWFLNSYKYY